MEKLSSILPSTGRVTSVDLEEAPPARPGSPTFGRKVGTNTVRDRVSLSPQAKEMAAKETLLGKNPKEVSRAKAVGEINRKFFETRLKPAIESRVPVSEQVAEQQVELEESAPIKEQAVSQYEPPTQSQPRLSVEA